MTCTDCRSCGVAAVHPELKLEPHHRTLARTRRVNDRREIKAKRETSPVFPLRPELPASYQLPATAAL